jgi:hypothetical protein
MKLDIGKVIMSVIIIAMFFFILMVSSALSGCEPKKSGNMGRDGYRFETAQYVSTDLDTNVILVKSQQEMLTLYTEKTGKQMPPNAKLHAFATLYPTHPEVCTLYMLDPRTTTYEPEFIGHEFAHCVFGQWHPTQDKRRGQG